MTKATKTAIVEQDYITLVKPVVTEKSMMGSQHGQITFQVSPDATKPQIKRAVERLFDVKVTAVNVAVTKGKVKRFKGILGKRSDVKKAIVTLAEGQTIDVGTGV